MSRELRRRVDAIKAQRATSIEYWDSTPGAAGLYECADVHRLQLLAADLDSRAPRRHATLAVLTSADAVTLARFNVVDA